MSMIKKNLPLLISIFLLTSCSIFSGGNGSANENKTINITIINGDTEEIFSVTTGKQAKIDTYYKPGYYLTGFFDEINGGTKYFDTDGDSVSYWDKDFPTVFYAVWDDIANLEFLYTNTEIEEFSFSSISYKIAVDSAFLNGIKGNLSTDLKIAINCKIKAGSWTSYFMLAVKDQKDSSGETFATVKLSSVDQNNYKDYSLQLSAEARLGATGYFYVIFTPDTLNLNYTNYIKGLSVVVTF